jgi:amino acid adenylation domain-containing protein
MKRLRVHQWFGQFAASGPERTAIEHRGARLTYDDLERRACRLANFLVDAGAPRGTRVGILADDVAEVVTAILAALKAGLVFVPIDPRTQDPQLEAMVSEASIDWFVVESALLEKVVRVSGRTGAGARVVCVDVDPVLEPHATVRLERYAGYTNDAPIEVPREADDCCYIYFTSGSTGRPKGIAGRLKAIDHFISWEIRTFGMREGVRVSQLTTPSFDASLRDFFLPLCTGGTICAPDGPDLKLDAAALMRWIDEQGVEVVHCVPSVFRGMLNEGLDPARFRSLTHVLLAGEPLLPSDVRRWTDVYGEGIQLVNLYGPSETTMTKFFHRVSRSDAARTSVPIGVPMEGASALIVDDRGRPSPRGAVGEIWIRTPYRTLGYFNRPELTSEVFIPNPFASDPSDLVYKTGDLGRLLTSGEFELVGRKDHQVKIRGERVELGAIEHVLRRHAAVVDAVVVDREDGAGFKYLCAYVVLNDAAAASDLRSALAKDLPPVMVPSSFVILDRLPRTLSGKVDRRSLPADEGAAQAVSAYEAPRTPAEETLAGLFAEVLGRARVGRQENFFEMGGHSLLATQLVSRVRKTFGVDLPVRSLFDAPTVAGLTEHLEVLRWAAAPVQASAAPARIAELEL